MVTRARPAARVATHAPPPAAASLRRGAPLAHLQHAAGNTVVARLFGSRRSVGPRIMPYRSKDSANFGKCNASPLEEKPLTKTTKKTEPWIKHIDIEFTSTATDSDGDMIPKGTLTATYDKNGAEFSDISANIVGGAAPYGLTDEGDHKVRRIEGCGYNSESVPKADRIKGKFDRANKYFTPDKIGSANMNFAVFFVQGKDTGNQAIHEGSLGTGSLACVHVGNRDTIRQINYHSIVGSTEVKVSYGAAALAKLCCERFKAKGKMVPNPCGGQKASACP